MTVEEGRRIATRSIALMVLLWAFGDALEIPRELLNFIHASSAKTHDAYLARIELGYLLSNVMKSAFWILAAGYFYRSGPSLERFFGSIEQ